MTFDAAVCVHSGECLRRLGAVFDTARRPWVLPDNASASEVVQAVLACPSGALRFVPKRGQPPEAPASPATVTPARNGPLHAAGRLRVFRADGTLAREDTRVALCRCGASRNKPFCDNRHREAGFREAGCIVEDRMKPDPEPPVGDDVEFRPKPDGSLRLRGPVEVRGQDGRILRGTMCSFCRCGHSRAMPFCDGSHKEAGFRDPEPPAAQAPPPPASPA